MDKSSNLKTNLIYIITFYTLFMIWWIASNFIKGINLNTHLSIIATVLGILSICLTLYFYKQTNELYINLKEITGEIKIYTKHIFTKESERVDKFIEKATETVKKDEIVKKSTYLG